VLLQAALNRPFTHSRHPVLPVTAAELAAAAVVDGVVRTVRDGLGSRPPGR